MRNEDSFGYWLKEQRTMLGLTQKELAEQIGYSLIAIQQIEQGRRRPSREIAERLTLVFDIPTEAQETFVRLAREGVHPDTSSTLTTSSRIPPPISPLFAANQGWITLIILLLLVTTGAVYYIWPRQSLVCSNTQYDREIETRSYHAETYFKRGHEYYSREEYECAIADFDQAILYSRNPGWPLYARGSAFLKIGFYDRAIRDFNQAIRSEELQSYDWIYWKRGLAYEWIGEAEEAITDFKKVQEVSENPDLQKLAVDELKKLCTTGAASISESC